LKQTFFETLIPVMTRHYYVNTVPSPINKSFDVNKFGPPYSYPFEKVHWKINEGLDELRSTCGIYIHYTSVTSSNGKHW